MVPVYPDKLSAHVAASNLVNTIHNDLIEVAYNLWTSMLGKKVLKVDNTFTKQVKELQLTIDHERYGLRQGDCHLYLENGYRHSVRYKMWVDVHYSYTHRYWGSDLQDELRESHIRCEARLTIGDIKNSILTEVRKSVPYRTNYSADVVLQARKELKELQEVEREIKSRIGHFGEY